MLEWQTVPHLEVKMLLTNSDSCTCAAIKHPLCNCYCVLVTVYPPEIASVNPTDDQDTHRMIINSFQTTYGPLR